MGLGAMLALGLAQHIRNTLHKDWRVHRILPSFVKKTFCIVNSLYRYGVEKLQTLEEIKQKACKGLRFCLSCRFGSLGCVGCQEKLRI